MPKHYCIRCKAASETQICPECQRAPLVNIETPHAMPAAGASELLEAALPPQKPDAPVQGCELAKLDRALLGTFMSPSAAQIVMDEINALRQHIANTKRITDALFTEGAEKIEELRRERDEANSAPIKRRVWWLMIDVHNAGGGDAELFGSEQEFEARQRQIIEEGIDEEGGTGDACEAAQAALDAGNIERAWAVFLNGPNEDDECHAIRHSDDYYYYGEEEVSFPATVKGGGK